MAVLEVKNICKQFGENTPVLQGVDFSLERGETVAIIGSSGSGKTTVACAMLRAFVRRGL